ncbi:hypothetical protein [Adhaeribacter rhizoryzae]|uniref:Uncharacterized protein n=1 Tax=Adhaeribacter rhizoryzae TaxID=2607907 RepID=A0A5M6DMA8_9BACT|nr:hypothetical protein [Adhaeribacter rhizoryzae]KAA5546515.1 hypothetical protein F0145_11545 [Adhaeribacter rhizoryzae]
MTKVTSSLPDKILAFIYFIGFEVLVYYILSYLLFDQVEKNPDESQSIIVQNWNSFVYFVLLYAAIVIGTMLLLTSALPRKNKPRVMRYFWLSWLGLLIMLMLGFN